MRVGVVLARPIVAVFSHRFMGCQLFQPDLVIVEQALLGVIDENRGGNVHGVHKAQSLLDRALSHQLFNRACDVHKPPAVGHFKPKMFRQRFHSVMQPARLARLALCRRAIRYVLEVVPGLIFVNESLDRHRPVIGLGLGTVAGKSGLHQAPGFLPLLHRMEERAGETRCVFIGFPSPRSSPHSFLAGRGWRA